MNKDTKITVRTAVGETDETETGGNIGQGTLEGANISAANIEYTVNMFFKTSMDELSYGADQLCYSRTISVGWQLLYGLPRPEITKCKVLWKLNS